MTCWFTHDLIRERVDGVLVFRCQHWGCSYQSQILESEMITDGPCQTPEPVRGQPNVRVRTEATRSKIWPISRNGQLRKA